MLCRLSSGSWVLLQADELSMVLELSAAAAPVLAANGAGAVSAACLFKVRSLRVVRNSTDAR